MPGISQHSSNLQLCMQIWFTGSQKKHVKSGKQSVCCYWVWSCSVMCPCPWLGTMALIVRLITITIIGPKLWNNIPSSLHQQLMVTSLGNYFTIPQDIQLLEYYAKLNSTTNSTPSILCMKCNINYSSNHKDSKMCKFPNKIVYTVAKHNSPPKTGHCNVDRYITYQHKRL